MSDDERAMERIREAFAAPEMSGAEVARFDAALERRLGPAPVRWWGPAAVVCAALMLLLWPAGELAAPPRPAELEAGAVDEALWADDGLWALTDEDLGLDGAPPDLPDEYLALAEVLTPLDEDDPLEVFR